MSDFRGNDAARINAPNVPTTELVSNPLGAPSRHAAFEHPFGVAPAHPAMSGVRGDGVTIRDLTTGAVRNER